MSDLTLTDAQEAWRSEVAKLISYKYLGTYSEPSGDHQAEGSLTIRSDLRGPAGLRSRLGLPANRKPGDALNLRGGSSFRSRPDTRRRRLGSRRR